MKYKILITTSGIGSRLGNLTDYTNKCLVRISNKPAISHIIESYPLGSQYVITLGHYGDLVKQFLTLTYPEHDFTFVQIDNYKGERSSLGYSILQAKKYLDCPFIFNACDTILSDNTAILKATDSGTNFCMGDVREDVSQYATLLTSGDKTLEIKRKGEMNYDYAYIGICGIKDYGLFFDLLEQTYNSDPYDSTLHEGRIINKMIKYSNFDFIRTSSWLDIGNVGELEKTRKHFKPEADVLEKREESIYFFKDSVVKFFNKTEICNNRVQRGKTLFPLVPQILGQTENFYKYEKVEGTIFSSCVTDNKFRELLSWSKSNLWMKKTLDNFNKMCYNFYITKTKNRIMKFLEDNDDPTIINGKYLEPIDTMMDKIDKEWLCNGEPVSFHGDFILDNILKTEDGFCLLDWRQDFAGNLNIGDIYYDLSKLNHNLTVNHEILNKKLYSETPDNCHILCNSNLLSCKQILKDFVQENGYDYRKVETLTCLIWLNMAPLHEYPLNKFLFNFGKLNLARVLEQ